MSRDLFESAATAKKKQQVAQQVRRVIEAGHSSDTDPLGSYTGMPADDPDSIPVQDADDL